jgi:hypothetical protein
LNKEASLDKLLEFKKPPVKVMRILLMATGLFAAAEIAPAQTWVQTSAPVTNWALIASSADGKRLAATANGSGIWISLNSGSSWVQTSAPPLPWTVVACSADEKNLVAVAQPVQSPLFSSPGPLYTSTNWGIAWTSNSALNVPHGTWRWVFSSADGSKLGALALLGFIPFSSGILCTSTNSGADWITNSLPPGGWSTMASSADGSTIVVAGTGIGISTNFGSSWTVTNSLFLVTDIAASASGTRLVAVAGNSIYISTNSGFTWIQTAAPATNWISVASSADGAKLVATAGGIITTYPQRLIPGPIYTSTDFGLIWVSNNVTPELWGKVTTSADGAKLFTLDFVGRIWTSQTTPAPWLNLTATNDLELSWLVPSTNFVLQECSDLTTGDWSPVTNAPVLNLSNLQNEVGLPLTNGNGFYRLQTP